MPDGTKYYKWTLNIAAEDVEKLGWDQGTELESTVRDGRLTLRRAKEE